MPTIEELIAQVQQQEKTLQFREFTAETALKIGLAIVERAKQENLVISIDIRRHGHQLFHYAFDGTSPDNDIWLLKKARTVDRFGISSYQYRLRLDKNNRTLQSIGLDPEVYAASGGAFPITIQNVGVIGSIAVSGLPDSEDHALVCWAIAWIIAE